MIDQMLALMLLTLVSGITAFAMGALVHRSHRRPGDSVRTEENA